MPIFSPLTKEKKTVYAVGMGRRFKSGDDLRLPTFCFEDICKHCQIEKEAHRVLCGLVKTAS